MTSLFVGTVSPFFALLPCVFLVKVVFSCSLLFSRRFDSLHRRWFIFGRRPTFGLYTLSSKRQSFGRDLLLSAVLTAGTGRSEKATYNLRTDNQPGAQLKWQTAPAILTLVVLQ